MTKDSFSHFIKHIQAAMNYWQMEPPVAIKLPKDMRVGFDQTKFLSVGYWRIKLVSKSRNEVYGFVRMDNGKICIASYGRSAKQVPYPYGSSLGHTYSYDNSIIGLFHVGRNAPSLVHDGWDKFVPPYNPEQIPEFFKIDATKMNSLPVLLDWLEERGMDEERQKLKTIYEV